MNKSMGLVGMARQGRGGDTTVAHMTPGEKVIPKEVAAMRPDLVAHVANAIKQYGGDPRKYTVGAGRINPRTGAEEFASEFEIQNAYQKELGRPADAAGLAFWQDDANNFAGGGFNTAAAKELAARPAPTPAPVKPWYEAATDNYRDVINKNFAAVGKPAWFIDTTTKLGGFDKNPLTDATAKWVGPSQDDMVNPYYKPGGAGYGGLVGTVTPAPKPTPTPVPTPSPAPAPKKLTTDKVDNAIDTLEPLGGTRIAPSTYGNLTKENPRDTSRTVTDDMTIQGRLNDVLGQDASGNYTNQVVRQAVERAQQQFAKRGLVNSSMAAQAGQEAAIAKAIEIVGPDAERFFQQGRANQDARNVFARDEIQQAYGERNNQNQWQHDANMQGQRISADAALQNQRVQSDANLQTQRVAADAQGRHEDFDFRAAQLEREQAFNLRANYVTAQDRVSQSYQRMVDTINTSQMTPEDKTAAIANAASIRDSEAAFINNLFAKQPNWSSEWLAMAVQPGTADLSTSTDVNALSTLANDPAQTPAVRQQAQTRLAQLQADPSLVPPRPTPTPAPGGSGSWVLSDGEAGA
jgi:hypothetical protein